MADITPERTVLEIARIAFADDRKFWDEAGNLKPIHELTDDDAAALAGYEVVKKNAEAGDGKVDIVHKIRKWDKPKALELLAKHFGLLTEKIEHSGDVSFRWQQPQEKS